MKFLVEFGRNGRLIWRVAEGKTRGEARINARRKEWSKFKDSVLSTKKEREQ